MMQSDLWYEQQYDTCYSVVDEGSILENWKRRAAQTRAKLNFNADLRYGAHKREILDFYPAAKAHGAVIFIHGGYWRMLSKLETSWVADGFVGQGVSVALVNYPLCPEVTLSEIRGSIIRSFVHIYKYVLNEDERRNIVVTGHSAGGHLAALHLATDWRTYGLPENPIGGVIAISGIYDVGPLMQTSMNVDIRITQDTALNLNLMTTKICSRAPIVFAVGGDEPQEFHRQAADQARAWAVLEPRVLSLAGANHFTVVDALADRAGEINMVAQAMLSRKI